jgi:long-chain fatty acid transport protein
MRIRCSLRIVACIAPAVMAVAPRAARGQGFGLNDIGSCAVARAYATTGSPCRDASTIYWNPGAAATLPGLSVYLGGDIIGVNGGFTADTTLRHYSANVPTLFVPSAFLNYGAQLGARRASVGIGIYVPYGLTSQWPSNFPGRFEAQTASLRTIYFQPNVAIEIIPGVLSVGGGPVIGHSDVVLDQALDLSAVGVPGEGATFGQLGIPQGTEFGIAKLNGSATAYGFSAGALFRPGHDFQIGARFLSALTFDYNNATARFQQVPTGLILAGNNAFNVPGGTPVDAILAPQFSDTGALSRQGVRTRIVHPLQAEGGVAYTGLPQTTFDVDYAYIGYQSFQNLPVIFTGPAGAAGLSRILLEDYTSSWSLRGSAEHIFGETEHGIAARAGFSYISTPAPQETVTPLLPDMNRYNVSGGVGFPLARMLTLDVAYLHVFTAGRRGRLAERTDASQTAAELNSGFYTLAADVFTASLRLHL